MSTDIRFGYRRPRLLFVIGEDWFFYSHFIDRARAAFENGFDVYVATRINESDKKYGLNNIKIIPINIRRTSINPLHFIADAREIYQVISYVKPDIVHNIALKPIVLGSLGAVLHQVPAIVNSPVGMGFVFSSQTIKARILRPIISLLLWRSMRGKGKTVIVENVDDARELAVRGAIDRSKIKVIEGAGLDIDEYPFFARETSRPRVMLAARMLREKGVYDFISAATILRSRKVKCDFVLVGKPDDLNPGSVPLSDLNSWKESGLVEWRGHSDTMPTTIREADIFCLPSYREGFPKVLIEAMASGAAVVATDVPGCRQAVQHMETGLLVPKQNPEALSEAIEMLVNDVSLRQRLAERARQRVEKELTKETIGMQTLKVYNRVLKRSSGNPPGINRVQK
ncbi:glycosyltransferase family 4 protein [Brucella oryzae]|uniref:glycosyltransferase family 4 protein n=1 Tax=Brucella oryzae TaxID=335286 RepID=UPI00142D78C8|nr:glycosyltransferase family 4 protein [Brucella oryzae]